MIRVIVSGICGRMGTLVARSIVSGANVELVGGVEMPDHENVGKRLCEVWGEGDAGMRVEAGFDAFSPSDFDVIVDFSTPTQAVNCAELVSGSRKGLVVGTTGLTPLQMAVMQETASGSPVVVAPNTSVAMNVLFGLVRRAAATLGDGYDVEIVETHHRRKLDAPSGTADRLLRIVSEERQLDPTTSARYGRRGLASDRDANEIGVHSLRAGSVVGRHEVSFVSDLEELRLSHEVFDRETFARGAVRAVEFVHGSPPGLYDMLDVLGLRRP